MDIQRERAHDEPAIWDGYRVLIDRLWPQGIARKGRLTLVHSACDEEHNDAVVREGLLRRGKRSP